MAAALGLKVDVDALPQSLIDEIKQGKVNLNDPATTLALLKLNAIVGVTGFFQSDGTLRSVGLQCAFCHSRVDQSFSAPGLPKGIVGHRLDGWANRDLNVGAIAALSPNLDPVADLLEVDVETVKKVLHSWGPGKFDAELFLDGKAFRPDGRSAAVLIPPAFGLPGVNLFARAVPPVSRVSHQASKVGTRVRCRLDSSSVFQDTVIAARTRRMSAIRWTTTET